MNAFNFLSFISPHVEIAVAHIGLAVSSIIFTTCIIVFALYYLVLYFRFVFSDPLCMYLL